MTRLPAAGVARGRGLRIAAALLALAGAAAGPAAVADRSEGPLPRALAERNAATEAARTLKAEIEALAAAPPSVERDARVALRRLAFDLLFHGASARADAQAMAIAGLRLHGARAAADGAIERAGGGGDAARAALQRFATGAAHGLEPLPPAASPESTLALQLHPLEEAVAIADSGSPALPATAWPPPRMPGPAAGPGGAGAAAPTLAEDLELVASFREQAVPVAVRAAAAHALAQARAAARMRGPVDGAMAEGPREELASAAADLRRIAAIEGWTDLVGSSRPGSRAAFQSACVQWAAALRDPVRAGPARRAMDALARESALAAPGEFERRLRTGDALAVQRCAGRSDDLLAAIDRARAAWAVRWATSGGAGAGSAGAGEGVRIFRVLAAACALDVAGRLEAMPGDVAGLDAWGGFAADPGSAPPHPKALAARAALALEALLDGRDAEADADLARVDAEAPIAAVLRDASVALGTWPATRSSTGCALAAARDAPGNGAYLGDRRAELMLLSRLLVEEAWARGRGLPAEAAELRLQAAGVARSLAGADSGIERLHALRTMAAGVPAGTPGVRRGAPR